MASNSQAVSQNVTSLTPSNEIAPAKERALAFAIAIILGVCCLTAAGVALGGLGAKLGWWQASALTNLEQIHSIIVIAAGIIGGVALLSYAIRQKYIQHSKLSFEKMPINDTLGPLVYGKDAWKIWEAEVVETIPKMPQFDWNAEDPFFKQPYKENYVLFYVPSQIRINGITKDLTLKTFNEIDKGCINYDRQNIKQEFENAKSTSGWILMSKKSIPYENYYPIAKAVVEAQHQFYFPHIIEVLVLSCIIKKLTGMPLDEMVTFCEERGEGRCPIIVNGSGSDSQDPWISFCYDDQALCTAVVRRF